MEDGDHAVRLLSQFHLERLLNQDQGLRRVTLLGEIEKLPALLTIERAAFPSGDGELNHLLQSLENVRNLQGNDIYAWYTSNIKPIVQSPDLKINLVYPATDKHIRKYSPQTLRVVTETPEIYKDHVRPYMTRMRGDGRLTWLYNILDGVKEQEDIIYRSHKTSDAADDGFLLMPDLNWDRKTLENLRLLVIVERRDIMSIRDLTKAHVPWLTRMYAEVIKAVSKTYPEVEEDMIKVYLHYQPTYYHMHLHVVSAQMEPNATQAVGKAFSLPNLIAQLSSMGGDGRAGLSDLDLTYTIGEAHDLWKEVFLPLKKQKLAES